MSETVLTSVAERVVSYVFGSAFLLMALIACHWGANWAMTWQQNPGALPSDMYQVLAATGLGAAGTGLGAWRLFLIGAPARLFGISLGWLILAAMAIATLVGLATA